MRIVQTSQKWQIMQHPSVRTQGTRNSYDFGIRYLVNYDFSGNFPNSSDDKSHSECVYYSVTWC
jgi:hypothetical protein